MRLLSYNIHKGIGGRDRRYRLDRICEVIEEQNPDLVCLQEVDRNVRRSKFHNQPKLLADYFSLPNLQYQLNVKLKTGGYGNLVLSRWEISEHRHLSLQLKQKKVRGVQMCLIDTPEGRLHLANWHLGLAEKERLWQARKLLTNATFQKYSTNPTLVIGDTNDWRNSLANGPFAHHGFRHLTRPASRFRSFPAYLPMGSLDKLFVNHGLTIKKVHLVKNKATKDASDHLPLVADFHLRSKSMNKLEHELS